MLSLGAAGPSPAASEADEARDTVTQMFGIVRRMTLRQRLVALVAVAIVPGFVALLLFIGAFHREREREVRDQALRTSEIIALEMNRIVSGTGSVLETLAFAPAVRLASPAC